MRLFAENRHNIYKMAGGLEKSRNVKCRFNTFYVLIILFYVFFVNDKVLFATVLR